jgi:nucleoside-diphosphate-sugar epimerase
MVYGPGVKGNLLRMMQVVARGRFPPLPETANKRSLVDVRDVVQAAMLTAMEDGAVGNVYIVTDGKTYSSREIYESMCAALHHPVPRWAVPLGLLRLAARVGDVIGRLSGRRFLLDTEALDKLTGTACYRSEKISRSLGYQPVYTLKKSLPEMSAALEKNE